MEGKRYDDWFTKSYLIDAIGYITATLTVIDWESSFILSIIKNMSARNYRM